MELLQSGAKPMIWFQWISRKLWHEHRVPYFLLPDDTDGQAKKNFLNHKPCKSKDAFVYQGTFDMRH